MRIAYLDCFAGIAGDMFLGALVDAGVPRSVLEAAAAAMHLGASLRFETVDRSGISATKVHVFEGDHPADRAPSPLEPTPNRQPELHRHGGGPAHSHRQGDVAGQAAGELEATHEHVHGRSLTAIRELILNSGLVAEVKALALATFDLLGHAEARIHNVRVDDIHFHEVGAVDAIVDIVAASAGIVHLQIDAWHCSPVNVGSGTVRCAHGVFPVPAPATADLLRGMPTYAAHVQKELVTPTGAALLRALAPSFGAQPAMAVEHIGYGAGTRNPANFPNVLRLFVGESFVPSEGLPANPASKIGTSEQVVAVLETALDDATPQLLAHVAEKALKLGALDVMLTPVIMKKGRPGTLLTLLANPRDAAGFEQLLLRETTTLGIRVRQDRRVLLDRSSITVETPYGPIGIKTGSLAGETLNANPEFEDCRRAAEQRGIPIKRVQAAAIAAYVSRQSMLKDPDDKL